MTTNNQKKDDGGPAFPRAYSEVSLPADKDLGIAATTHSIDPQDGMSLRDWFAGQVQADDRLVKCVRAMDDVALEIFALHPTCEREEQITETGPLEGKTQWLGMSEVQKVTARLELEAKAIARVRYMQADAMLEARRK